MRDDLQVPDAAGQVFCARAFVHKYELGLVTSIFEGLIVQVETDAKRGEGKWKLHAMEIGVHVDEDAVDFDSPPAEPEVYDDSISEAMLDLVKVKAARREELDFFPEFGVYRQIPRARAVGGQFVTVKWMDVNKGDGQRPVQKPPGRTRTESLGPHDVWNGRGDTTAGVFEDGAE